LNKPETNDFHELFDARVLETRFLARLRWFATRWLSDAHAGEDAAQEALRRVLQALTEGRVKQPEALPAFVYQTARHVCSHHRRAAGRERRMLTGYGTERSLDDPAPDPLNELVSDARKKQVREALAAMDEEDRDLLSALYVQERSPEQLAAELHLSDGALRTRKHRALKRLSQHLTAGEVAG
jgi:RNA polymerase sigma factor (sigma-70 family)